MSRKDRLCRLWKRWTVAVIAGVLALGLMGCSLDDVFSNFNVGDVPFDDDRSAPTDMGAVDNRPGVPEDDNFEDPRYDPPV